MEARAFDHNGLWARGVCEILRLVNEAVHTWSEFLERQAAGRGPAALAWVRGAEKEPVRAWTDGNETEPAFLAYSVTKIFTAVVLLALRDSGRVALEDRLARWFPAVERADRITIRQILQHTAGLPDYGGLAQYHEELRTTPRKPWSAERFAAETYENGLWFEPGKSWSYSNPGYALLRRIAEHTGEEEFGGLVERLVCRPLGLRRTHLARARSDLAPLAPARSRLLTPDGSAVDVRDAYDPGWVFHGVLVSTASEMVLFLSALFRGDLLSSRSVDDMTALVRVPHDQPPWCEPSYGLGLMADPASPWGRLFGHNGEGPGYTASVFHAPDVGPGGVTVGVTCGIEEAACAEQILRAAIERIRAS